MSPGVHEQACLLAGGWIHVQILNEECVVKGEVSVGTWALSSVSSFTPSKTLIFLFSSLHPITRATLKQILDAVTGQDCFSLNREHFVISKPQSLQ